VQRTFPVAQAQACSECFTRPSPNSARPPAGKVEEHGTTDNDIQQQYANTEEKE